MHFEPEVLPFLRGDSFSNGLSLRIACAENKIPDRLTVLDSILANKRVVHVGCCDHVPLIRQKIATDTWLHARICKVADKCYGVDTSGEGIQFMRDELGYADLACANIAGDDVPGIEDREWDFMLLGEILEHLDDPVGFLKGIRARYGGRVVRAIITVPNALSLLNVRFAFKHRECINTDHRHWFSPYTLGRMLVSAGLTPEEFSFCEPFPMSSQWRQRLNLRSVVIEQLLRRYPAFREGLIMIARI